MRRYKDGKFEIDATLNKHVMQHFNYRVLIIMSCLLLSSIVLAQTTRDEVYKQLNSFFDSQRKKNNKRTVNTDNSVKNAINDYLNSNQFETKTFVFKKDQNDVHVELKVDYPINGNVDLIGETRLFIRSAIEKMFDINIAYSDLYDGQMLVNNAGIKKYRDSEKEKNSEYIIEVNKSYENERCVSFCARSSCILECEWNAHCLGETFRKKDGIPISVFELPVDLGLVSILKKTVKENLQDNFEWVYEDSFEKSELPFAPPHLTKNGVQFDYQNYEIGPGVLGQISVVIPYEEIKQYMTDEARELIE